MRSRRSCFPDRAKLAVVIKRSRAGIATLLLKDCRLVNVWSREIHRADIAINGDTIVSTERGAVSKATKVVDCDGLYALPGLIDAHMHVDATSLWPGELARVLVPLGTTTVFVDTTNVLTTGGPEAVRGLIEAFEGLPLRAYFTIASYSPLDPARETVAYELGIEDLEMMLSWPECVGLGETVSSKILAGDDEYLSRIALCLSLGQRVSGHGGDLPRAQEAAIDAYVAAGVRDDHCVMIASDVLPRLRRGLSLFTVESAGRENLSNGLLDYIRGERIPTRHLHFAVDNMSVSSIVGDGFGYLDRSLKVAIGSGLPPVDAVRMGTLNTARHYGKANTIGSLTPGRMADVLLVRELDSFPPETVITSGRIVARNGTLIVDITRSEFPQSYRESVRLHRSFQPETLKIATPDGVSRVVVRVVDVNDQDAAFNAAASATLRVFNGGVESDPAQDVLKLCVVERYGRNGNVALAFARGFGLERGAIATSVSVPSNNIVAVGATDADMWLAINHVAKIQGGYAVVADGAVLADVNLRIGGIVSESPYEEVMSAISNAETVARETLGCTLESPLRAITSTVLSTLPDYGMTDRGLIDVATQQFVPLLIPQGGSASKGSDGK